MIKKVLIVFACSLISLLSLMAQQTIKVAKFYEAPEGNLELTALINSVRDDNGQVCALIKVQTTEPALFVEEYLCAPIQYKMSEVYIYFPPGEPSITIKIPGYKALYYYFPIPLESSRVYFMDLVTSSSADAKPQENYLRLSVNPPEAQVRIDGDIVITKNGELSKLYTVGKHKYEAACKLYQAESGEFEITPDAKTSLDLNLKPNFGFVNVTTTPESGATIFIDGTAVGVSPFKSDKLPSGKHVVEVVKEMYKSVKQEVTIQDGGATVPIAVELPSNFAEPVITCSDQEAEIWINGEKKGKGTWTGRLAAGVYKLKSAKEAHRDIEKSVSLKSGDNVTIILDPPTPIYGRINVTSTPFDADIYIDGKKMGSTPELLSQILIGNHELRIEKKDYTSVKKNVLVEENKTTDISVELKYVEIKHAAAISTDDDDTDGNFNDTRKEKKKNFEKKPWTTFVTLNGSYSPLPQFAYGVTAGQMKICGWYVSLMSNFNFKGAFNNFKACETYNLTGASKTTRLSLIGGFVVHPTHIFTLSFGAGFGYRSLNLQTDDDTWYSYKPRTFLGADVALGFMINLNKFLFSAEIVTTNFKTIEFKLGVGLYYHQ